MHEIMKCGHCKETSWIPDQCGKPEHFYCVICQLKESSYETDTAFGEMMDERDRLRAEIELSEKMYEKLTIENAALKERVAKLEQKSNSDDIAYEHTVECYEAAKEGRDKLREVLEDWMRYWKDLHAKPGEMPLIEKTLKALGRH